MSSYRKLSIQKCLHPFKSGLQGGMLFPQDTNCSHVLWQQALQLRPFLQIFSAALQQCSHHIRVAVLLRHGNVASAGLYRLGQMAEGIPAWMYLQPVQGDAHGKNGPAAIVLKMPRCRHHPCNCGVAGLRIWKSFLMPALGGSLYIARTYLKGRVQFRCDQRSVRQRCI